MLQLRSEAHLGVHDTVVGQILGAFVRHSLDRVTVLHHPHRVGEGLEVEHEVVALRSPVEPGGEVVDVGRRQILVAVLLREFDDGAGPDAPVEVVVEQRLGGPLDEFGQ